MAITRHIYIYEDVEEKLKQEENVSSLINKLLRDYYETAKTKTKYSHLTVEQKEELIKYMELTNEAESKVKELENVPN